MIHFSGKTLVSFNASQFPLKLTPQNCPTWHAQLVPVFRGHNLMGYIDRTPPCPSPVPQKDEKDISNSDYEFWICQDQLILAAIIASTIFSAMHLVSFASSSVDALHDIKIMTEDLAFCGSPVSDIDLVIYVLHGVCGY
ncbi:hypothetical protein MANES_13G068154v8 [Manihot esculenta]|uniref:Uncharacterized protein n=1 Tax=Manihot esculenta TaxID=3983 RepID=A0ACB7GK23_MANES|nr:hypothetical protein MANES_13G068154v8 [Manihot esculenta]